MWWRLGILAVAAVAVMFLLLTPMPITVKVELPPSNAGAPPAEEIATPPRWVEPAGQGVTILLVLLGAALIGKRIIRRHGKGD